MKEVSADENLLVTLRQGAIPYIPFKSNSQIQTNCGPMGMTRRQSTLQKILFGFLELGLMVHKMHFLNQVGLPCALKRIDPVTGFFQI